ncbi:hypothetical protein KM043_005014 [Ampulex compressa]|nr:hypothetical protein KM043_005014 [Ampulex compressa]
MDVKKILFTQYWRIGVYLDLRCPNRNATDIFYKTSAYRMYDNLYAWFILGENFNDSINMVNDSAFNVVTDFVIAVAMDDRYDLYEAYNHCKYRGGTLKVTKLGAWSGMFGLEITLRGEKIIRRWDHNGLKLQAAGIVLHRPKNMGLIEYLTDNNAVVMDNWPKFGYSVLIHLAYMFNFTMELTELQRWGRSTPNGPLMSGLQEGIYDLGYYPSIITDERLYCGSVIIPMWPVRTCFIFRTVPSSKVTVNMILKPFSSEAWFMIVVLLIVTILVLSLMLKIENGNKNDYVLSALISFAALCQQGSPSLADKLASRVALLQIMLFGLLVYNYYSAAIVSSRLNTPLNKMNDSLYSLIRSGMKLAAEKNVFFDVILRIPSADVQHFRGYWMKIPEKKRFLPVEEGINRVAKISSFAYHADPTDVYRYIAQTFTKEMICQLTEIHLLHPAVAGIWTSHNQQFLEVAKIGMMRVTSAGLRKREVKRWSPKKPYCDRESLFISSVTIYETAPMIILLMCGMILSVIICLIENIIFRKLQAREEVACRKHKLDTNKKFQTNPSTLLPLKNKSFLNMGLR